VSSGPRPDYSEEAALQSAGIRYPAGLDEAGRGALAGPVAAAAVILGPKERWDGGLSELRDSKQLSPPRRERLAAVVRDLAIAWAIGSADAGEVDELGIVAATALAMRRALAGLDPAPDFALVDGLAVDLGGFPQRAIVRGDQSVASIAAASVLAKTWRDDVMLRIDRADPAYGFARHKGYGTGQHLAVLKRDGPGPWHRATWRHCGGRRRAELDG
jgi:ribonuclease HII